MANGKLSTKQLADIISEARTKAEKELAAAQDYEQFQYAAGEARGASYMLHCVMLSAFGGDGWCSQYEVYSEYINQRISFHLQRVN